MHTLSPRQQSILNRTIETHIETAQPVGSQHITSIYWDRYKSSYSPATVRSEMGLLEELGYLTHPHTSAGRVPTDLGYRYYVDHTLEENNAEQESLSFEKGFSDPESSADRDSFLEQAVRELSASCNEMSLISLVGKHRCRLFVQGSSRMLEKPEFQDARSARPIFEILEEKKVWAQWLLRRTASDHTVSVTIGRENETEAFQHCGVVSSQYHLESANLCVSVVVLGPRRMRYAKAIPTVATVGSLLKRRFETILEEEV